MFSSLSSQLLAALPLIRLACAGWAAIPEDGSFHSLANVPDNGPLVNSSTSDMLLNVSRLADDKWIAAP